MWDFIKKGASWLGGGRQQVPPMTSDPYGSGASVFQGQGMGMQPYAPTQGPAFQPGGAGYNFLTPPPPQESGSSNPGYSGDPYGGVKMPEEQGLSSMDKWMLRLQGGGLIMNALGGYLTGRKEGRLVDEQIQQSVDERERRERRRKALESSAPSVLSSLVNGRR